MQLSLHIHLTFSLSSCLHIKWLFICHLSWRYTIHRCVCTCVCARARLLNNGNDDNDDDATGILCDLCWCWFYVPPLIVACYRLWWRPQVEYSGDIVTLPEVCRSLPYCPRVTNCRGHSPVEFMQTENLLITNCSVLDEIFVQLSRLITSWSFSSGCSVFIIFHSSFN